MKNSTTTPEQPTQPHLLQLWDEADKLWELYHSPELSKKEKKQVKDSYNKIAKEANSISKTLSYIK